MIMSLMQHTKDYNVWSTFSTISLQDKTPRPFPLATRIIIITLQAYMEEGIQWNLR